MLPAGEILDRGVPDQVDTAGLPTVPAAELDHLAGRTDRWVAPLADVPAALRARAVVVAGRPDEARELLDAAIAAPLSPQGVAAVVWTASRVGEPRHLDALAPHVDRLPRPFVVEDCIPVAPTAVLAGLIAAARGSLDVGAEHLREGVADGDRRAPVWGAIARLELARVLASARDDLAALGEDTDAVEAERSAVLSAATMCFAAGGYQHLLACAEDLAAGGPGIPPWGRDAQGVAPAASVATPGRGVMVPLGDRGLWRVGFGVQPPVPVGESLGMSVLHHLLVHGGRRVSVVELDRVASGEDPEPLLARHLAVGAGGEELGVAALRDELLDERARSRVSKLVRRTVDRLEQAHPLAGRHLRSYVSTGWACCYDRPEGVSWSLSA